MTASFKQIQALLASVGQDHVLSYWNDLDQAERERLIEQIQRIDFEEVQRLRQESYSVNAVMENSLHPVSSINPLEWEDVYRRQVIERGEEALRAGRIAAFTVAGGQGTRLGFEGPKGMFPVTPIRAKSLFQVFAEKIRAAQKRYATIIPWFIMTSPLNDLETRIFFQKHGKFGLQEVYFLVQGMMPILDVAGKLILENRSTIALGPDGHGGCFRALERSGAFDRMEAMGIDVISYFQVDNPLVHCMDPLFIGLHLLGNSEFSSKMVQKKDANERVGLFCRRGKVDGPLCLVEYSDMPEGLLWKRKTSGELLFNAGNIAVHLMDRSFAKKMGSNEASGLSFHKALKKFLVSDVGGIEREISVMKFELFVFDALPFARNPIVVEVQRLEEFSPVKNAVGVDSIETSRRDQVAQFNRWLAAVGNEKVITNVEVSPLFADTQEQFIEVWNALSKKPILTEGVYVE